jgi:hypothetical protein
MALSVFPPEKIFRHFHNLLQSWGYQMSMNPSNNIIPACLSVGAKMYAVVVLRAQGTAL